MNNTTRAVRGWRWKRAVGSSFSFSWVSSKDTESVKCPLLCLVTSCSHFKTTSLHPSSGPRMLRTCSKAAASSIPAGLAAARNHKVVISASG